MSVCVWVSRVGYAGVQKLFPIANLSSACPWIAQVLDLSLPFREKRALVCTTSVDFDGTFQTSHSRGLNGLRALDLNFLFATLRIASLVGSLLIHIFNINSGIDGNLAI